MRVSSATRALGAGCLVVVVLTHFSEALHLFPWMHWGDAHSVGHYLDFGSAVLGLVLFPLGYLLDALKKTRLTTVLSLTPRRSLGGFPADINGIISSFAITLVSEFDAVIRNEDSRLCPLSSIQPATRNCGFRPHVGARRQAQDRITRWSQDILESLPD
jgi:hypothetical protein